MPMMHSEDIAIQDQSLLLFKDFTSERIYEYAIKHRDIIQKFGRFPHRNQIFGRISTEEEIEFLKQLADLLLHPGADPGRTPIKLIVIP